MNFGALRGAVPAVTNIVYYRRGQDELSLNITNACPNACVFCIRDRDPGWGVSNLYLARNPSVEEILGAFTIEANRLTSEGVPLRKVKVCGYGEPILRFSDLIPIARGIRERSGDLPIQVTTTGWPYYRFVPREAGPLQKLRDAGVSDIYLSLSSPRSEDYRKWVKPGLEACDPAAFADSLRFAREAREAGLRVTLGFMRLAGFLEEEARALAESVGVEYRVRDFEPGTWNAGGEPA